LISFKGGENVVDLKTLMELANSESFFAILLVIGIIALWRAGTVSFKEIKTENRDREEQIIDMFKDQLEKADKREEELMGHLDKSTGQMENIAGTMKEIQGNLSKLENRVDDNFMMVWKEIGRTQPKQKQ
jgi:peptidoglycan hydrolase CwlO-like protein